MHIRLPVVTCCTFCSLIALVFTLRLYLFNNLSREYTRFLAKLMFVLIKSCVMVKSHKPKHSPSVTVAPTYDVAALVAGCGAAILNANPQLFNSPIE